MEILRGLPFAGVIEKLLKKYGIATERDIFDYSKKRNTHPELVEKIRAVVSQERGLEAKLKVLLDLYNHREDSGYIEKKILPRGKLAMELGVISTIFLVSSIMTVLTGVLAEYAYEVQKRQAEKYEKERAVKKAMLGLRR
jgi:hypothetical protein